MYSYYIFRSHIDMHVTVFIIFILMSFFRLNSHTSVISLEGGGIFNDPGRHKC